MVYELLKLDDLLSKITAYAPDADITMIRTAYNFSQEVHCDQRRKEGKPFFEHPLAVASILADMHLDCKTVVAGLLHDTVEDTDTTVKDIVEIFGDDVGFMVNALTKLKQMEFKTREETQAENFRKMFVAMAEDVRVILIKFADRLHNMRTLKFMPPHKQKLIAAETLDIYAPLANRLGMGWLRSEFEDLGFKYLHPEIYEDLYKKVAVKRQMREEFVKTLATTIEEKLRAHNIPGRVSGRVKNFYGIHQKMQAQRVTFEDVNDMLGLRVITQTKEQCYIILGLIHSLWMPVPGRFKDYVAMPKSNRYQSLHTTVLGPGGERTEFQIRTEEMNLIAEKGIAAHWLYKERGRQVEKKDAMYIEWLRELVHLQKDSKDAREFLEMFKGEIFSEVVFVFTPAGEIRELPAGATPVDFAYAIHTHVGNRCVGARCNGRMVPLKYQLKNGDTIEIITSNTHSPSRDWLNFVVTHKAKNRIRQFIKVEQRKQGIELGSSILEDMLIRHKIKLSTLKSKKMDEVIAACNYKTLDDLLMAIGYGKLSPRHVVHLLNPEKPETKESTELPKPHKLPKSNKGIHITGVDNLMYTTAKCCFPIPGDNIYGFITKGKGVTIHRTDCHNYKRSALLDENRTLSVTWESEDNTTAPAKLYVETMDKPGMLAALTNVITGFNINLSHLEARSSADKHAHFVFILDVRDKPQLMNLSTKLLSSDGVISVNR
ncbi:RelA/SpoT family protein [Candidatus Magnetominusculus xianensis]|uniref:GTP pyrophosphokinase n=1 Tax=Candidatus Magnetominusculus xianensis TaxID=1748249 RepID=A0ABR5SEL8_9BACT|nr:bifunctional (p)ppGpp synthetase/guanosine-3',5'-bis(diphosphate) 3'-pyrophosphohydrolase [Candidatus Magnetominusculus xianensis]KWT84948.1 GTP pyrophosphokinase [Candidatus Magnetominusculus xianensis]MBF0404470.1 bifunctional (p)ppGpp synthetase/guanosine-3',5'-bis(diphosphate) 3'-pyrophosphohydrolase [Nitrospirota bacterium]